MTHPIARALCAAAAALAFGFVFVVATAFGEGGRLLCLAFYC